MSGLKACSGTLSDCAPLQQGLKGWDLAMRRNALADVYDVLKAVYHLEREIKLEPLRFSVSNPEECSRHLKEARHQLHQVLDDVYASDFRNRSEAA
jgi:hypothetical protein